MAPNVCGLGRITPYEAWLRYVYPESRTVEETEAMEFGQELEDPIARVAARRWGFRIRRSLKTLHHPEHPWMVANIDREVIGLPAVLECKNRGFWQGRRYGDDFSEEVQPDEFIQAQHYLAVTGKQVCYLAVLIGGQMLRRFELRRDDAAIEKIIRIEEHFWKLVKAKTPPPPQTHADCASLWPEVAADVATVNEAQAEVVAQLVEVKKEIARLEEERERLDVRVKMLIGEKEGIVLAGEERPIATWKHNRPRKVFHQDAFAQAHPDLFEQFCTMLPGERVLRTRSTE